MIPDLGSYAVEVLSAYGVSIAILAGIVVLTYAQARHAKRRLDEVQARTKDAVRGR